MSCGLLTAIAAGDTASDISIEGRITFWTRATVLLRKARNSFVSIVNSLVSSFWARTTDSHSHVEQSRTSPLVRIARLRGQPRRHQDRFEARNCLAIGTASVQSGGVQARAYLVGDVFQRQRGRHFHTPKSDHTGFHFGLGFGTPRPQSNAAHRKLIENMLRVGFMRRFHSRISRFQSPNNQDLGRRRNPRVT